MFKIFDIITEVVLLKMDDYADKKYPLKSYKKKTKREEPNKNK